MKTKGLIQEVRLLLLSFGFIAGNALPVRAESAPGETKTVHCQTQVERISISKNSDDYEQVFKSLASQADKELIRKGVFYLAEDPLPRRVLNWSLPGHNLSTLEEADLWIEKQLAGYGYKTERDETKVRAFGRDLKKPLAHQYAAPPADAPYFSAHNIIAGTLGTEDPSSVIVIIAHKDSQSWIASPGANDNAIGTCCALELSRLLRNYRPRHTLRFIFCNEEHTPWTSITAAKNIRDAGEDVLALINMDGVGGKSESRAGHFDNVTRYTTPEGDRLADLVIKLNNHFKIGLEQSKYRSDSPGDDDGSFINAGFPWSVLNIGSMPYGDPNYHVESDTPEKSDFETARRVVQLTLALILHLDYNGRP